MRANTNTNDASLCLHLFMSSCTQRAWPARLPTARTEQAAQAGGRDPDPLARFWPSCRLGQSSLEGYGCTGKPQDG